MELMKGDIEALAPPPEDLLEFTNLEEPFSPEVEMQKVVRSRTSTSSIGIFHFISR
jgi:hypothetical protein